MSRDYEQDIIGTKPTPRVDDLPMFAIARDSDPVSSHRGADHIASKAKTQRATLLAVYRAYPEGLTDEEASSLAGIEGGWKRCSELRNLGLIAVSGKRQASSGVEVRVCSLTEVGRYAKVA
jgi:hypothetical protein